MRALAREPARRYQTGEELRAARDELLTIGAEYQNQTIAHTDNVPTPFNNQGYDLALYVQTQNALSSRIRGKHLAEGSGLSHCLPGFRGRLAGIWGEFDATAAPYLAQRRETLRQFQPQASFDILPGAGHWVQYEAHEPFNRRLRELVEPA